MNKIIHYCWFGGNPLSSLTKKCIKSWEKYLPEYEIKLWDESNFDVNMTEFSRGAYEAKKWAFVSDVARVYALKKYGGIYFDTDMLITKDIDFLLKNEFFVGWESKDNVAVGVLGVRKPNNKIINTLWEQYRKLSFDKDDMYSVSIPKLLTNLLKNNYGLINNHMENQELKEGVTVYARDYFYPLSYDRKDNLFTENTCMIHYYDASWIPANQKRLLRLYRILGRKKGDILIGWLRKVRDQLKRCGRIFLFPLVTILRKVRHQRYLQEKKVELRDSLEGMGLGKSLVIYNPHWIGTAYATKELFESVLPLEEIYSSRYIKDIAELIVKQEPKVVIFSAFAIGWSELARQIKERNEKIKIKIIWHGSNSVNVESYDWDRFKEVFALYNDGVISTLGFVKKSLAEFYKEKGYRSEFLMNTCSLDGKDGLRLKKEGIESGNEIRIGLYASGDRWVKNFYNQLSAASLIDGSLVDCIPITPKAREFAEIVGLNIVGIKEPIPREDLFKRMANNDINIYATFVECAPLLPLESFELGVPCITGNNHHYWENHELRNYLVVDELDNVMAIYKKIKLCLENKEKVLKLYSEWKKEYDQDVKKNVKKFLE